MTEKQKAKIADILTKNGYSNIRFENGYLYAVNPSGQEAKMTEKECIMTLIFAGNRDI